MGRFLSPATYLSNTGKIILAMMLLEFGTWGVKGFLSVCRLPLQPPVSSLAPHPCPPLCLVPLSPGFLVLIVLGDKLLPLREWEM